MQNTDTGFQITAGSAERVPQKPIASETDPDVKRKNASSQEVDWGLQESTPFMAGSFKLILFHCLNSNMVLYLLGLSKSDELGIQIEKNK